MDNLQSENIFQKMVVILKKTSHKLRIIIKRYAPLLPIAIGLYTLLYFLCGKGTAYMGAGLWTACLYAFMMRFCDDIADYQKDLQNDKAPIKLLWLSCGATVALIGVVLFSVLLKMYWLLLPCVLIILPLAVGKKKIDWIKLFFAPSIMIAITLSVFAMNIWVWILSLIVGVLDGVLIFIKSK